MLSKALSIIALVLATVGAILFLAAVIRYNWMNTLYEEYFVVKVYFQLPVIGYVDSSLVGMSIACAIVLAGGVSFALSRRLG